MKQYQYLKTTVHNGNILEVLLNRPDVRNAINPRLKQEWNDLLDAADADPEIRVVTVRGEGPVFSAGGDIKEAAPGYVKEGVATGWSKEPPPYLPRAWYFRKVLIAGVHKYVGPEAFNLLGYCDFIIAAEKTKFSFEVTRFGSEGNASSILAMQLPMRVLKKLYLMGGWFEAEQALKWDFVQRVVPVDAVSGEVRNWAVEASKIEPTQVRAMKHTLHRIYEILGLVNLEGIGNRGSGHGADGDKEFYAMILEKGMKAALKHRDSRFDATIARV
ncbi:MAG: enoyl-CoA hydratase/isomerase family protein [Parvibaculaceae bacterium]